MRTNDPNDPNAGDAIDQGISRHLLKIQGLIIPMLLSIIGFFVVQSYFDLKQIAADNQRFTTYIGTNNQRMEGVEKRLTDVEAEQRRLKEAQLEGVKKEADDWSVFWKEYGFFFSLTNPRSRVKSH